MTICEQRGYHELMPDGQCLGCDFQTTILKVRYPVAPEQRREFFRNHLDRESQADRLSLEEQFKAYQRNSQHVIAALITLLHQRGGAVTLLVEEMNTIGNGYGLRWRSSPDGLALIFTVHSKERLDELHGQGMPINKF